MSRSIRVTASIVNYNTWGDTINCVNSLVSSYLPCDWTLEVIIHDNGQAPPPKSLASLDDDRVQIRRSSANLGYGGGHNSNLRHATGELFFVLNPDVIVDARTIQVMASRFIDSPDVGAVAPLMRDPDGKLQRSCRRFPSLLLELYRLFGLERLPVGPFGRPLMLDWDHLTERTVDQPAGAALLVRTAEMRRIGGFDEAFPMYFEDVDLCRRIVNAFGPILFFPSAVVIHGREQTARRYRTQTTFWIEWSRVRYYGLHEPRVFKRVAIRSLVVITAFSRGVAAAFLAVITGNRELGSKACGYGLFLLSRLAPVEAYWRARLLRR